MKLSSSEISALKKADHPQDVKRVCSYSGMVNYLKRFIPDFSTITYPLRKLTHQEARLE